MPNRVVSLLLVAEFGKLPGLIALPRCVMMGFIHNLGHYLREVQDNSNRPITGKIKVFDESGNIIYANCDSNALRRARVENLSGGLKKHIPRKGG